MLNRMPWPRARVLSQMAVALGLAACDGENPRRSVETMPPEQPGFSLAEPHDALMTAWGPELQLSLHAYAAPPESLELGSILQDRALGESAIRSLVTLTDMTNGLPLPYAIGNPVRTSRVPGEELALTPLAPLTTNAWYRLTLYPGESQQLVPCRTRSSRTSTWLTAPETWDIYTYSRPMVGMVLVSQQSATQGFVQFVFSELVTTSEWDGYPMAVVSMDGVALPGCPSRYACAAPTAQTYDLILAFSGERPAFTEITLRLPHALKSEHGGSILDGTKGNPHAVVDGDWAVYTFKAADMIGGYWYYVGK